LTLSGAVSAFLVACVCVLIRRAWQEMDPLDPGKQFATEIAGTLHADALRLAPSAAAFLQVLARVRHRRPAPASNNSVSIEEPEKSGHAADLARVARNGLV
jgi:hypothetical protein